MIFKLLSGAFDFITPFAAAAQDAKSAADTLSETGLEGLIKQKGFIYAPGATDDVVRVLRSCGFGVKRVDEEYDRVILQNPSDYDSAIRFVRDSGIESY